MQLIKEHLKRGDIGVLPTDTLYGLVAPAFNQESVERLYQLRTRDRKKPFIILINDISALKKFHISLSRHQHKVLKSWWPGSVSVILPCAQEKFAHLHRGTQTLAFRVPAVTTLRTLLKESGPLVAPSANPAGQIPATNIFQAQDYFGNQVEFYADAGQLGGEPSTLAELRADGSSRVLRQGRVSI